MPAPNSVRLPRLSTGSPADIMRTWDELCRVLEGELAALRTPAGQTGYVVTNPSASRALNVSAATTGQVAAVLGTLLSDLQKKGQVA